VLSFSVGAKLEVVDKNRICRVRYAEVISSIGKRLHLRYYDENDIQGNTRVLPYFASVFISKFAHFNSIDILQRTFGVMRIQH